MITKYFGSNGTVTRVHAGEQNDPLFQELALAFTEYQDANGDPVAKLAKDKETMWRKIHDERERRYYSSGFHVSTYWFHSDQISRGQHQGLKTKATDRLAAGGLPTDTLRANNADIYWKTMSGAWAPITVQLALDIFEAVSDFDAALFAAAQTHKTAMEAAPGPLSYDYLTTLWPPSFA